MQNLEPELKLKAQYTKQVLIDQINVQRQTSIENMGFSFLTGIINNLIGASNTLIGGLGLKLPGLPDVTLPTGIPK